MTYVKSTPLKTPPQVNPTWLCQTCRTPIRAGHGFIGVPRAAIRRLRTGQTGAVSWHTHHGDCAPSDGALTDTWQFWSAPQTWADVTKLELVLAEQWWWLRSDWTDFTAAALNGEVPA